MVRFDPSGQGSSGAIKSAQVAFRSELVGVLILPYSLFRTLRLQFSSIDQGGSTLYESMRVHDLSDVRFRQYPQRSLRAKSRFLNDFEF